MTDFFGGFFPSGSLTRMSLVGAVGGGETSSFF
jgi:hypothetical protein